MAYYSSRDLTIQLCGPRGIRTPDLLNAIETRSQLRYGPGSVYELPSESKAPATSDLRLEIQIVNREPAS